MKLRRVKILGFKTFADKTEFELDGDIIAVVGPNGCGKSNIVDAVLWGLGESNSRAIRAQTGKEVIFAGSSHRKPHGFAEVTLHFDNEDGGLPIDTPEVSVTRRVDRSGQGEYEINRRSCRLKDVADLLADSGLGRAGYAIVGQSEIDQALAASPQQRRAWIDEAAGVHRYRIRRQEAVRRLDSAKQHLTRVRDVLTELDAQREPLAEEAEVAMRYKSALKSLRQVECGLLVKELASVVDDLRTLDETHRAAMALSQKEAVLADDFEAGAEEKSTRANQLEAEADKVRDALQKAKELLDQSQATLHVARAKLENLDVLEGNLSAEAGAAQERLEHAESDLAAATADAAIEEAAYSRLQEELSGAGDEAKLLRQELERCERDLAETRLRLADYQRAELEVAHREQRAADVAKEIAGIDATLPDLNVGIQEAEAALQEKESEAAVQSRSLTEAQSALHDLRQHENEQSAQTRKLLAEVAALDGKRRGIESTIEAHEGLAQGAKSVLALVKKGELDNKYIPVGDCVQVEPELALAIDTALGASANDLIVPDESFAKEAIALLKEYAMGRATFQPITLMRPSAPSQDLKRVQNQRGVVGLASEIVGCKPAHRPVIDSLLGRVLVVETIDDALRLAKTSGWSRCVTLEGEVVYASGAVTGGRAVRQTAGLVQRQAELAETVKALKKTQSLIEKAQADERTREERRAQLEATLAQARTALEPLLLEVEESKAWLASLRQELSASERSRAKLEAERAALTHANQATMEAVDLDSIEARRDDVWKKLTAKSADAESAELRLEEAFARLEAARKRLADCARRLQSVKEAEHQRQHRASNLEPERARHQATISEAEKDSAVHESQVQELRALLETALESRRQVLEEARSLTEQAQRARKSAMDAETAAHQAELKRARSEGKRAAALERLLDEYGVSEEQALDQAPTTVVPDDASSLVSRLRRELKDMGEVNLGAIEAFERLSERYDELNGQAIDIESGMEEIETSVRELDKVTLEKFSATFTLVKDAFAETFRRVFGGGEGHLELVRGADDLDAGVEIQVTIPGKKRQRLELLSGGERALSAIAFLFALLKTKPSPLVILDEIDAPLDGRNVERFIGLMRDFSKDIQFILVTHNPMTIESADIWFGVTMQEPGVSTLVPFRVTDKTVVKAVVPDVYLKG